MYKYGTVSDVNSRAVVSPAGASRRIPTWASPVVSGLARDRPAVVTKEDLTLRLAEAGCDREPDSAIRELRRMGWLVHLPVKGTWTFIPPGEDAVFDPYLPLRAWLARDQNAGFMLAGASAAWHLGYLDRRPEGRIPIWLPHFKRLPDGLAPYVSVVRIPWKANDTALLAPRPALLARRRLDIIAWATGLPAFGPEALLVQLAARPTSFGPWTDLVTHLDQLIADCSDERLERLLSDRPTSVWQRASYLVDVAGEPVRGQALFAKCQKETMPVARFANAHSDNGGESIWVPGYQLVDEVVAPLLRVLGKA